MARNKAFLSFLTQNNPLEVELVVCDAEVVEVPSFKIPSRVHLGGGTGSFRGGHSPLGKLDHLEDFTSS